MSSVAVWTQQRGSLQYPGLVTQWHSREDWKKGTPGQPAWPGNLPGGGPVDTTGVTTDRDVAAREVAARMATAAAAWLGTLDPAQHAVATGSAPSPDAESDADRRRWFYT